MMDTVDMAELGRTLWRRRAEARRLPFLADPLGIVKPERGRCHEAAEAWVRAHPGDQIVRGWLYDTSHLEGAGYALFHTHSLIEREGELFEITALDNTFCRFLALPEGEPFETEPHTVAHIVDAEVYAGFLAAVREIAARPG